MKYPIGPFDNFDPKNEEISEEELIKGLYRKPAMKMDQIAFYCSDEAGQDKIKKMFGLENAEWIRDEVTAKSLFQDGTYEINVADLQFNYDLGIELEILRYKKGKNWHEETYHTIF